jgi:hypothetical protein
VWEALKGIITLITQQKDSGISGISAKKSAKSFFEVMWA